MQRRAEQSGQRQHEQPHNNTACRILLDIQHHVDHQVQKHDPTAFGQTQKTPVHKNTNTDIERKETAKK